MDEFEIFWRRFPRRVGKLAALKAYGKARKLASAEQIVQGVDRYIANKPAYADWCHPVTFLSQGRWMDEYEPSADDWTCPHTPTCESRWRCQQRADMDTFRASEPKR